MRGNSAVTVGACLQTALVLAWYLEDAARVKLDCMTSTAYAAARCFTADEAALRATWNGRLREWMWDYLTAGDEEAEGNSR